MAENVRDRRTARWCWQDRAALARIRAGLGPTNEVTSGLAIYLCLTERANANEQCWPKMAQLAADAGVGEATARRRIRDLEQLGLITVTACISYEGDTSNTYTLIDPPEGELAPDWRQTPPPIRPLVRLEDAPRQAPSSLSPRHRQTHRPKQGAETVYGHPRPNHHDRASPITMSARGTHHEPPGPIVVSAQLTSLKTSEQAKENEEIPPQMNEESRTRALDDRPPPAERIDPPGVPASILWATILADAATALTDRSRLELQACYLAGNADELVAVAPSIATGRTLCRRHQPELERAARQIVKPTTRLTFHGVR